MKLLFLICTLTGLGWFGLDSRPCAELCAPAAPAVECEIDCETSGCTVIDVTCSPDGTCIVTCADDAGRTCTVEVDCDADCDEVDCDTTDCSAVDCSTVQSEDCPLPCAG